MKNIYTTIPTFEEFTKGEICSLSGADLQAVQAGLARLYSRETGEEILPDEWYCSAEGGKPGIEHYRFSPNRRYALFEQGGYVQAWRLD